MIKKTITRASLKKIISSLKLEINKEEFVLFDAYGLPVNLTWQLGVRSDLIDKFYFTGGYCRPGRPVLSDDEDENCLVKSKYILQKFCDLAMPVQSKMADDLAFLLDKIETAKRRIEDSIELNAEPYDALEQRYASVIADAMFAADTLLGRTTRQAAKGDKMATTKKAEDKKVLPTSTEKSEDEIYSQQRQRNMKKVYRLLQQKRSKKNERTR